MSKKVTHNIKLNIPAGKATAQPPVGPALAQAGVNIGDFIKKYNEATSKQMGFVLPVEVTVYEDRSYTYKVREPLAADLIKRAAGITKGASNPLTERVGVLTKEKLKEVAKQKMPDLNAHDEEMAMRIIAGTARSMGVKIED